MHHPDVGAGKIVDHVQGRIDQVRADQEIVDDTPVLQQRKPRVCPDQNTGPEGQSHKDKADRRGPPRHVRQGSTWRFSLFLTIH